MLMSISRIGGVFVGEVLVKEVILVGWEYL